MGYQRAPERWTDRHPAVARMLATLSAAAAAGLAAGMLVVLAGPPPEHEYVLVPPSAPHADPELVLNTAHCEKGADTFGDVARAVTDAGGLRDDAVITELRVAEARMTRRASVPSDRLTETFGEATQSLRHLRLAIEQGTGIDAALEATLDLMATLEQQCQDAILPTGTGYPG